MVVAMREQNPLIVAVNEDFRGRCGHDLGHQVVIAVNVEVFIRFETVR
jgi:hypothetical protein